MSAAYLPEEHPRREGQELTFTVHGMDCASCARTVEGGVSSLQGVTDCEVSFATQKLRVSGDIPQDVVVRRVEEMGYGIGLADQAGISATDNTDGFFAYLLRRADTRLTLVGALLLVPGLILDELMGLHLPVVSILSLTALVVAGWPVFRGAWAALRYSREININVLMSIATIGAVLIGAYTEGAMIVVLYAIGEALEGYTVDKARHAIGSLVEAVPATAVRLTQEDATIAEESIAVADLAIGDLILVRPGQAIPMDGMVKAGVSDINQSAITGESSPLDVAIGSDVYAGSINGHGTLEIEVTRLAQDNTISRLIRLVEEAQERRAPSQRTIDRFARYYTPTVVVLAALVALLPPLILGEPVIFAGAGSDSWFYRGLALLIVACPCALVISTPVSIISAIGNAARNGILFKGGAALEQLGRVKTVVFDKTGTLTTGRPAVVSVRALACATTGPESMTPACNECRDLLALASAVERRSEHPLAGAVVRASAEWGVNNAYASAADVTAMSGLGVMGQVAGRQVIVGSHRYFDTAVPHASDHCDLAHTDAEQGYTPMMVSFDGDYQGTITVADSLRWNSPQVIEQLRKAGVEHIAMLTGDNRHAAQTIATKLGISDVRAELLPEDKMLAIEQLRAEHGALAMVGDGINDGPALATADVGIAIGNGLDSTNKVMETADVTLMAPNLQRLPFIYRLCRKTMSIIRANIIFSLAIKLIFLFLVLFGYGTLWMAVLADVGASLLVTIKGLRLLHWSHR